MASGASVPALTFPGGALSPPTLALVTWLVVIAIAMWRGGAPERLSAGLLLAELLEVTFVPHRDGNYVLWRVLAGDVTVLAGLIALCLRFSRAWLMWAVGLQLVAVATHVPRMFLPVIRNSGYATLVNISGYLLLVALMAGVLLESPNHVGDRPRDRARDPGSPAA